MTIMNTSSCLSVQLLYPADVFEVRVDKRDHSAFRMPLRETVSFKVFFYSGVQMINNKKLI